MALIVLVGIMAAGTPPSFALSWSPETPLTTNPAADFQPKILQASDWKIWVVWHSYRVSTSNVELFYKTSTDGGLSWSADTRLTNNPATDGTPAIMQSQDGTIWVFWASDRTGNYDIFYKTTSNNGVSWSSDVQLTDDPGKDIAPAALQTADGKIWVAWTSRRTLNDELFYRTSSDNGLTWTNDTQLTFNGAEDRYPSIYQAKDGTIWLTWTTNRDGVSNFEIYYRTYNGVSWSTETRLTKDSNNDMSPSITQAKDATIWILWDSDRNKLPGGILQTDLYYNVYDGVSWLAETQFTTNDSDDMHGCITQGKTDLFITWVSARLGNYDIFLAHAFVPVHDVATIAVEPYASKVYSGNPLKINVTVANEGTYGETFAVSVYRSGTLIGTQTVTDLVPDESRILTFIWETAGVPKGYLYTISATAATVPGELETADNSLTDGAVQVKIPGDINSDNIVNVYDAIVLSTNFTHSASEYPDCDVNGDGYINVLDAIMLISHWGETAP